MRFIIIFSILFFSNINLCFTQNRGLPSYQDTLECINRVLALQNGGRYLYDTLFIPDSGCSSALKGLLKINSKLFLQEKGCRGGELAYLSAKPLRSSKIHTDSIIYLSVLNATKMNVKKSYANLLSYNSMNITIVKKVENIPNNIKKSNKLVVLRHAIADLNNLKGLPMSLKELQISYYPNKKNKVDSIPSEVFNLYNLQNLGIGIDSFTCKEGVLHLPSQVTCNLPNLTSLSLSIDLADRNTIKFIRQFKNLKSLSVSAYSSKDFSLLDDLKYIKCIEIDVFPKSANLSEVYGKYPNVNSCKKYYPR